jgi:hypothetical protein
MEFIDANRQPYINCFENYWKQICYLQLSILLVLAVDIYSFMI